jgi:hypothetical protein
MREKKMSRKKVKKVILYIVWMERKLVELKVGQKKNE